MVLFVTGRCNTGCYYCPVSFEKKGRDVIYANELKVSNKKEIWQIPFGFLQPLIYGGLCGYR